MIKIRNIKLYNLSIPLKKTIQTTWSKRSGTTIFLIEITTENGVKGFGEVVSFFDQKICKTALENMIKNMKQFNLEDINKISKKLTYSGGWLRTGQLNDVASAAWAGIETAIYDAISKEKKIPLQNFFGGELSNEFAVSANLDVGPVSAMCNDAKKLIRKGYKNLFIKVAKNNTNLEQDLKMLNKIRKVVGENVSMHLDINGAWTVNTSLKAIRYFERNQFNIHCIEQPVMELEGLKKIRLKSKFPIGVNELLSSPQRIFECIKNEVADVYVLDIFETGGLRNLWYISKFLNDNGLSVCCRAHGGSNIHYITSLKILSTTGTNDNMNIHQIYDFDHKFDILKWHTKIKNGKLIIESFNKCGNEINQNLLKKYEKNFKNGINYEIYKSDKKKNIPNFPKY